MTRLKKNRSLKRIHKVKTGNTAKLKREAGNDRQTGKRVKNRVPSVFEKFLADNPDVKAAQNKEQQTDKAAATPKKTERKVEAKDAPLAASQPKTDAPERSLLDQLEDKDFKDIY
ncbi:hypothetical protein Q4551_02410 [Oceanobacter sp. 5_MG-2023]|uniref:hypothetical protein n=1 Tax=Oceanobacter sp. 5_MG-2023 TaxID=3062645 RepID=UPI0026E163A1|nr:hypothetical protein [Oceanobacter sp. 5_MG-2023]MDO6681131.1 hypothetical protein [Oceanobacter sp. 5_MG-2023]